MWGGTEPHQCWWRKRFIAVWIPYVIVQLIAYWPFHSFELFPFLLDLTLIKPLYHYGWYLQHIFLWYAIFYCVRRVKCLNRYRIIVFSVVSMLFFFLFREIRAEQSLSFLLGIMLSEKKEWQEDLFIIRHGLLFTIFGIACLAVKQFSFIRSAPQIVMNCVQLGIKLPIGFGLVIFCYKLTEKWKWIGTALGAVGTISYELYLIHGYVLSLMPVSFYGVGLFIIGTAAIAIGYWWMMKKLKPVFLKLLRVK